MPTENTNNKNVTLDQLKKSLSRSKAENDKAIAAAVSGTGGPSGETATDAEVDAMLDEVFGPSDKGNDDQNPGDNQDPEGGEA